MTITNKVSLKSVNGGNTPVADVVDAPTIGTATDVGTSRAYNNGAATVAFTPATTGGAATSYTAVSTPGSFTATGASSPLTVAGLQSATSYTFKTYGTNASGTWSAIQSSASASMTATTVPDSPTIGTFTDGGTGTTGTLSFTAPATGGSTITNYKYSTDSSTYTALSPAQTSSPLSLTGLTAGTYNFSVKAVNANGDSAASSIVSGTVITPSSFESIATATPTGTSTVTFSSIPSTYKSLQIRITEIDASGGNAWLNVRFNGDTGGNYRSHRLYGDGNAAYAGDDGASADSIQRIGFSTNTTYPMVAIIDLIDYASTSKNKTLRAISGMDRNVGGSGKVGLNTGLWLSTSAVNSVTIFNYAGSNFAANTTIALYGVK